VQNAQPLNKPILADNNALVKSLPMKKAAGLTPLSETVL